MRIQAKLLGLAALSITLTGCAAQSSKQSPEEFQAARYHLSEDSHILDIDTSHIPDAIPRTPDGPVKSTPYTFNNVHYKPMPSAAGYAESGIASWYGAKFHGYHTANGEIYDMYDITAAHKTLPLPSYARVTNLNNGLSIIVRVNDRGPFHHDRLIDLSWAAAAKLDFHNKGTARVKVEGIDTSPAGLQAFRRANQHRENQPLSQYSVLKDSARAGKTMYLQIAALSDSDRAYTLRKELMSVIDNHDVHVIPLNNSIYRIRIGPIATEREISEVQANLEDYSWGTGQIVFD